MLLASLIVGGIVGGVKAVSNAKNRKVQAEETALQLKRKQSELNEARTNLTDSYNLAIRQSRESTQQANDMLNLQAQQTEAARDYSLKTSAQGSAMQDQLAASQIAALQVDASQKEGQAVQNVATSGMRNTGSALNVLKDTNSKSARALGQAMAQRNMARFSDYSSARANYLNANNQLTLYRQQVENNKADLRRYEEKAGLEYRQNMSAIDREQQYLNDDVNFMNSGTYRSAQNWGFAADIFGGISTGFSVASSIYGLGTSFGAGSAAPKINIGKRVTAEVGNTRIATT